MPFGEEFKIMREARGLSLRDVEKETEISNAYLSQLESNKVKQPSPIILYKLAQLYNVAYENLMEKVGYPIPKGSTPATNSENVIQNRFGKLTKKEEQELFDYLHFIRNRRK